MPGTNSSLHSPSEQTQQLLPLAPFRYAGGDLGLGNDGEPWIYFVDQNGQKWLTHSVELVLRYANQFAESGRGGRDQLLASAALHYGLDVWALIKGRNV